MFHVHFFYAECDPEAKTGEYVGRSRKALFGTRDAPQLWNKELRRALETIGFESSKPKLKTKNQKPKNKNKEIHPDFEGADFLNFLNLVNSRKKDEKTKKVIFLTHRFLVFSFFIFVFMFSLCFFF